MRHGKRPSQFVLSPSSEIELSMLNSNYSEKKPIGKAKSLCWFFFLISSTPQTFSFIHVTHIYTFFYVGEPKVLRMRLSMGPMTFREEKSGTKTETLRVLCVEWESDEEKKGAQFFFSISDIQLSVFSAFCLPGSNFPSQHSLPYDGLENVHNLDARVWD